MTVLSGAAGARTMSEAYDNPALLIDRFERAHRWLSNFHFHPVVVDGMEFPSGEHAFNALKTVVPFERKWVRDAPDPGEAKRRGRRVTLRVPRTDWDSRVRYDVMHQVQVAKYTDPTLAELLIATGDALLIEGTGDAHRAWHDQVWGQCGCDQHRPWPGRNALGRDIMAVRRELAGHPADWWPRVAVTGHRPQHLTDDQATWARGELDRLAVKVRDAHGTQVGISGCALGADTWWARSTVRAGLRLWAYVPFLDQPAKWPRDDQAAWRHLLGVADRTLVLGAGYDVRLLHARNQFMVRDADMVIAVWDPGKTTGGTAAAVKEARATGTPLVIVDVAERRTRIERRAGGA